MDMDLDMDMDMDMEMDKEVIEVTLTYESNILYSFTSTFLHHISLVSGYTQKNKRIKVYIAQGIGPCKL